MRELKKRGHEVSYLENPAWTTPSTLSTSSWLRSYACWFFNQKMALIQFLAQDLNFDVIYAEKMDAAVYAYFLSKKMSVPFVLDSHDFERVDLLDKYLDSNMTKYIIKQADRVFAISNELYELYKQIREDVIYLPSGADLEFFLPHERRKINDQPTFIWCGNMKGLDFCELILEAFSKLRGGKLYLVGDGPKKQVYEKLTSELGVGRRVEFTGWVSDTELLQLYEASDIGLLPFKDDLWNRCKAPSKVFEFMAMQIPFVCTVGEPAYIVNKLGCGLVAKPDVTDFSSKMAYAIKNLDMLRKKALESREYLVREQNYESSAKKVEHELKSII
jgi:glycosyltransferase involved in cell wall biosynthesis